MSSFSCYFSIAKLSFIMGKGRKKTKPRRHACFCSRVMENPHQCGTNGLRLWFRCADAVIHAAYVTWFSIGDEPKTEIHRVNHGRNPMPSLTRNLSVFCRTSNKVCVSPSCRFPAISFSWISLFHGEKNFSRKFTHVK